MPLGNSLILWKPIKHREVIMRRFAVTIASATIFIAGAPIIGVNVDAAPMVAPGAIHAAADRLNMVERAQFIWLGHNYCWYDDGWNGPGWYWCDQYLTPGIGWGGGYGWHHWRGGHPGGRVGHPSARVAHPSARVAHPTTRAAHPTARAAHPTARVSHPGGGRPSGGGQHRK